MLRTRPVRDSSGRCPPTRSCRIEAQFVLDLGVEVPQCSLPQLCHAPFSRGNIRGCASTRGGSCRQILVMRITARVFRSISRSGRRKLAACSFETFSRSSSRCLLKPHGNAQQPRPEAAAEFASDVNRPIMSPGSPQRGEPHHVVQYGRQRGVCAPFRISDIDECVRRPGGVILQRRSVVAATVFYKHSERLMPPPSSTSPLRGLGKICWRRASAARRNVSSP